MPNPPQERESDPTGALVGRRSWPRLAVVGLVAVFAFALAVAVSGVAGGAPAATRDAAVSTATSSLPIDTASPPVASASPTVPPPTEPPSATPGPSAGASASPAPAPQVPDALAAQLDARLAQLRKSAAIPGVSVAIAWDDGRLWLGAAGMADIAAKEPVTTGTAFALASVSKTLTAAVVLQLVGQGRLALDEPVASLLPAYELDPRITVRMLLDHTSGLPDYFLNPKIEKPLRVEPDAAWTPERAWSYVR
ncbi:MAG: beta-lactamase family protein, partial [Chloroflexi bacterium]|nr:beta-lactamase family protein [Chloroflexota bacterium]